MHFSKAYKLKLIPWETSQQNKKRNSPLRISSVNVTKSELFCGFGHIY